MALEDAIIGGGRDFDPRGATEDLARNVSDLPQGGTVDVRMLNTRLARKLNQKPPEIEEPKQDALDFSDQAAPPEPADVTDTTLDFSDQAVDADPIGPPMPPPQPVTAGDYPKEIGKGIVRGARGLLASPLKGAAAIYDNGHAGSVPTPEYDAAGNPTGQMLPGTDPVAAKPIKDRTLYHAGEAVEKLGGKSMEINPAFKGSWTTDIAEGAGSLLGGIAVGMIPGVGPAAAGTAFGLSGVGEAAEKAVQNNATTAQGELAALWGGVAGATDVIDLLLPSLGSTGKALGFIKRVGAAAVKGAIMEGGQEGLQQLIQNAIAKNIYKPDQDMFEDVPRSVAIGAILGGGAGSISGAAGRREPAPADPSGGISGAAPSGGAGGTGPSGGGPQSQSSPEDIADFVKRAKEGAPTGAPEGSSAPDPSTMSEAEWINAYAASRASHDNASDADILKAAGMSDADIAGLTEAQRIDAVIKNAKSNASGNAQGNASSNEQASRPQEASDADYSTLRAYGYSDEDIDAMSPRERARQAMDAVAEGIDPADAAAKYPRQDAAPKSAETASGVGPDKVSGTDSGPNGTREAPIRAQTADDVIRALPSPPTEAQAKAENYKHAHVEMETLGLTGSRSISIETGVGQDRKGVDADGKPWSVTMKHGAYGRIKGTKGADGEALDIFVGPHPTSPHVFVVDQLNADGSFDEHKIMAGYRTPIDALHAYANAYNDGGKDRVGHVKAFTPEEFKDWLKGDTTKPLKETPAPESAGDEAVKAAPERQAEPEVATGSTAVAEKRSDTGQNVPESRATLKAQQDQLIAGDRAVQMFPKGTREMPLPPGMRRTETDRGVFHYDPKQIRGATVEAASQDGRENELLGLGSIPKSDILDREARGEKSVSIVERTPDGTEVRAAAGTEATAEGQRAEMESGKSAGNTITIEPTENVIAQRKKANDTPLSLLQFLASKGGIKPHGDLTAMDAHRHRVQIPGRKGFFGLVKSDGLPLDMAREAAEEAGYLRGEDANKTSTERQLLDLIDAELRGQRSAVEGEELAPTKIERQREDESSAHARNSEIDAAREQIEAEYPGTPDDLIDAAAAAMVDENLDVDTAMEAAAMRMVDEDADYETPRNKIADTFGKGAIDAVQRKPAPKDGGSSERASAEERRPEEGKEASRDGERVPAARKESAQAEREEVGTPLAINKFLDHVDQEIARGHMNVEIAPTTSMKDFRAVAESRGWLQAPYGKGTALWSPDRTHAIFYNAPVEGNHLNVQWVTPSEGVTPPADKTEAGEQAVIPGAERIGQGEQAQRAADQPLKPKANQRPADDGLFGDSMDQRDLMDMVEQKLGADAQHVAPVDIARAAEIMEANPGMEPETAFGQAVVETAVEQGFITEQEAVEAYGEEVTTVLEAGSEGASGRSSDVEQEGAEPIEERAGGAAEAGVIPSSSEAREAEGDSEGGSGAVASAPETTERPAADGNEGSDSVAAEDTDNAEWWDKRLTRAGRKDILEMAGMFKPDRVLWKYLSADEQSRLAEFKGENDGQNEARAARDTGVSSVAGNEGPLQTPEARPGMLRGRGGVSGVDQRLPGIPPRDGSEADGSAYAGTDRRQEGLSAGQLRVGDQDGAGPQSAGVRGAADVSGQDAARGGMGRGNRDQAQDALSTSPQRVAGGEGSRGAAVREIGGDRGIQSGIPDGDATAGAEAVPPTESGERAGSPRRAESARGASDAAGASERGAAAADGSEPSRSGGTDASGDVPVSERGEPKAKRETGTPERPTADSIVGENYHIEPGSLGEGRGPKAKSAANIEAIVLANELTNNGRVATASEQNLLAQYVGWGGIKGAFPDADGNFAKGFEKIGAELQGVLSTEEYETARRSIQYAHYTAEKVINAMWRAAEKLGFNGGSVFEPGMGVGHFAGLMPSDIAARASYAGVEMDHVTARIAKLLYPQWGVRRADFTAMPLAENTFDLAIGNPPFADIAIKSDPKYKQGFLLHDYFFAKSLDGVRPGGLLMFVTSAGTMNKIDPSARNYLADRAELVGAIRLPGNAFKENAGTEVTTDIVILRKLMPGEVSDRAWTETAEVSLPGTEGKPVKGQISRYFAEHPEMVLGEGDFADKLYEGRYSVKAPPGYNLTAALAKAIDSLPDNVMRDAETPTQRAEMDFETTETKDGSFYVKDGKLMQQRDGAGYAVEQRGKGVEGGKSAAEMERIRGLIPIRDALRESFAADLADNAQAGNAARVKLNNAYDAFVAKHGPINKAEISRRRPNSIQQESARSEAREEARYGDAHFDEGSFDPSTMIDQGKSLSEIARARADARQSQGEHYREGTFDPEEMADIIIDKRPNIAPFADDQENYRLRAIEHYDETTGKAEKGPAFLRNIITKDRAPEIKSVKDAALYVLNQTGRLDIDRIAAMYGKSPTEVIEELGEGIYRVPGTTDTWETNQKYLSGNVRKKLAQAQEAARRDPTLRRNVEALEANQPAPLAPSQIGASLGMPWIPADVIEQFGTEALGLEKLKASYTEALATWNVSGDTGSVASVSTWGTNRRNATALLTDVLNRQSPKIYDQIDRDTRVLNTVATQAAQEKMQALRDKFDEWVFSEEKRADRLATYYNENYNNLVVQEFDGEYLTTPGIADGWSWRPHQKRVIARIIQQGNTYMAHAVGAGKTSAMIGAGMEMRRLGLVKKPMYVVPNHMLGQFTKEFYEQYPTARIMVADDRQFHTDRRKQFMANAAVSDIDAVIITKSSFGMIPMSDAFKDEVTTRQVAEYRSALADMPRDQETRITRSRIEKQIERLTQRLSGKSNRKTDSVFTFEQMGVDFLFVDEAHDQYRKLDFTTQMSNLKGITPDGAAAAWDLYIKSLWLEQKNPGRNLVLASGTPVTNTMAELYTVSRYLQMKALEERGLKQFDAWAGAFGENVTELEQDAAGGYKPVSRFAKFVNVAELSAMVRQVMDVVTSRQLEQYVVRPKIKGGKRKLHLAEQSEELIAYNAKLAARMKAMEGRGKPKPGDDIMLTVINDGRHAAIDMRLVDGTRTETPSKLDMMIDNMFATWKATKAQKFYKAKDGAYDMSKPVAIGPATQMAFVNLGISGARGLAVPDYIRSELVRRGVPRAEIALIGDYKNHVAKQKLFNDMNEGKVRFLIGSVAKMGTGVNAQRRLYAVHNLDPLWYPSDDEQRNGRALRQGNWNPEIEINDYAAKGTYDSTMWGMMEKKARFIQGFFEGDPSLRSMEDLGEASQYEQAKALTTNDPRLMRLTEMRQELEKANRRKAAFDNDRYAIRQRRANEQSSLEYYEGRVGDIQKDIAQRVPLAGDAFTAKIGKETLTKRVDFAEALIARLEQISTPANSGKHITVGEISGFSLVATPQKMADEMSISVDLMRNGGAQTHVNGVGTGAVRSIESTIGGFDIELKSAEQRVANARKFLKDSADDAQKKFTGGADMEALGADIRTLQAELSAKKEEPKAPESSDGAMPDLTVSAQQQAPEIENLLRSVVRHLVGDHAGLDFSNDLMPIAQPKGWGKVDGAKASGGVGARGLYWPGLHWIRLALVKGADATAFHESYHAIEYQLQTPQERELMERETPRMREYVGRARPYTKEQLDSIAPEEIRAIAFEEYAKAKSTGADAGKGLHASVRRWFDKLINALEQLRNGLRGLGFTTYRDVFAKAYRGDYSRASGSTPRAEAVMDPLASLHHDISEHLNDKNKERLTALRVKVQDKFLRVRNMEENTDANLPGRLSAYQSESLYYGRTGQRLEELDDKHIQPLIKDMRSRNVTFDEIGDYISAKGAFERNQEMDRINHGRLFEDGRDLTGRGSGLSDEEAQAILDKFEAEGRTADLEAINQRIREIINETRQRLVDYGLINQTTADAWAKLYPNYVPYRGFAEGEDNAELSGIGKGFDTRGQESKKAFGRVSRSANPLIYVITQAEMSIVRGEKNKVGNTLYRFMQANPNPKQWSINRPDTKPTIDNRTGLVVMHEDPNWGNNPNVFVTKIGGKPMLLHFEDANVVRALKNMGGDNMGEVVNALRVITTTLSRLSTQFNPDFILPNLARDMGEAFINMREDQQKAIARQFMKHLLPSMGGAFRGLRGSTASDKYTQYFYEFDREGGRVHFFGLDNPAEVEKAIKRHLRQLEGGVMNKASEMAKKAFDAVDMVNSTVENMTRLAYYITLRENGVSAPDASMATRNLTVDFNKGGELRGGLNAAYMFGNVGMQGIRRMSHALRNKHVRRAAYGLMMIGALSALAAYATGGDDDSGEDYYSKIPEYERDKNIIILYPKGMGMDGKGVKLPLPYGFSMFKVLGDRGVGVLMGKEKAIDAAGHIFNAMLNAFNPLGEEASLLATILPTLLRAPYHIVSNVNWTGRPLNPTSEFTKHKPDSERYSSTAPEYAKFAARTANSLSGGSPYKSGFADVHPGTINHVVETMTGGAGKFLVNLFESIGRATKAEFDATRTPIIRRFAIDAGSQQSDQAAYYKARDEAKKNGGDAIKQAQKDKSRGINREAAESFLRDNTNSIKAENVFKAGDAQMKPLRDRLDKIKNSEMPSEAKEAATKEITDRMRKVMNDTRKRYREMKVPQ